LHFAHMFQISGDNSDSDVPTSVTRAIRLHAESSFFYGRQGRGRFPHLIFINHLGAAGERGHMRLQQGDTRARPEEIDVVFAWGKTQDTRTRRWRRP
jgi:hypothetical protein